MWAKHSKQKQNRSPAVVSHCATKIHLELINSFHFFLHPWQPFSQTLKTIGKWSPLLSAPRQTQEHKHLPKWEKSCLLQDMCGNGCFVQTSLATFFGPKNLLLVLQDWPTDPARNFGEPSLLWSPAMPSIFLFANVWEGWSEGNVGFQNPQFTPPLHDQNFTLTVKNPSSSCNNQTYSDVCFSVNIFASTKFGKYFARSKHFAASRRGVSLKYETYIVSF